MGCTVGQNRREAVAEGKHKPSSYFAVLYFPSWTGPGMAGSVGRQTTGPQSLRYSPLCWGSCSWDREFPLWQEPHPRNFVIWSPNRLRIIFFTVQRTSCKLGIYSDHLMDRSIRSAQNLLSFRLPTEVLDLWSSTDPALDTNPFQSYNEENKYFQGRR